jgi:hypothetical protein
MLHVTNRLCSGAISMTSAAPVAGLVFLGPVLVVIGVLAGHVGLMVLGVASLFGAGVLTVLDGRRA